MHVCKGGQISEIFGGAKFPVTPDKKIHKLDHFALSQEFCPFWILHLPNEKGLLFSIL